MKISDLTQEERKAFEEYLLSTYRYDAATGKLINKKWSREYPGVINKNKGYVSVFVVGLSTVTIRVRPTSLNTFLISSL